MNDGSEPPKEQLAFPGRLCNEASYADLFFRLLDAGVLIDGKDYRILDANDACEKLLGVPYEQLLQTNLLDMITENKRPECSKMLRISQRRYHPVEWTSEIQILLSVQVSVRIVACLVNLQGGREVIQLMIRDITREIEDQRTIKRYVEELELLNKRLETLSVTDEMTGLANFRHFKNLLQMEHGRGERYGGKYSIVFMDLDYFKQYNDLNGHPAGDALLREMGRILRKCCRTTDLPARYGGEEFAVLCPGVTAQQAKILAERIRTSVETTDFAGGKNQPTGKVTLSLGVAGFPDDGDAAEAVLESADKALYFAKNSGKNQVVLFEDIKELLPKDKKVA